MARPGLNNGYTRYLAILEEGSTPSGTQLRDAWNAVSKVFIPRMKAAGHRIAATHHWNWNKTKAPHSAHIFDPRNLVPVPSTGPGSVHEQIHRTFGQTRFPQSEYKLPMRSQYALEYGNPRSLLRAIPEEAMD